MKALIITPTIPIRYSKQTQRFISTNYLLSLAIRRIGNPVLFFIPFCTTETIAIRFYERYYGYHLQIAILKGEIT